MKKVIELDKLISHPRNPRGSGWDMGALTELARSIEKVGVTNTPIVRPHEEEEGHYVILSGHRRRAAVRDLGWTELECEVREVTPEEELYILVSENMFRADLDPIQTAEGYAMMCKELKMAAEEVASAMGVKVKTVERYQSLLSLGDEARGRVARREMTLDVASMLLELPEAVREEGEEMVLQQLELGSLSRSQAGDLLEHEVLRPYEAEMEWKKKEADYLRLARVGAGQAGRAELDDPNVQYGEWHDVLKVDDRDVMSSVDVHERAAEQSSSLLWLHVAQRHNMPVCVIPHGNEAGYLVVVDSRGLEEAERSICEGRESGRKFLNDPDVSEARKRQAQEMVKQEVWLAVDGKSAAAEGAVRAEEKKSAPEMLKEEVSKAEGEGPQEGVPEEELPGLEEYLVGCLYDMRHRVSFLKSIKNEVPGQFTADSARELDDLNADINNYARIMDLKGEEWA